MTCCSLNVSGFMNLVTSIFHALNVYDARAKKPEELVCKANMDMSCYALISICNGVCIHNQLIAAEPA